jgi:hypothetical protein
MKKNAVELDLMMEVNRLFMRTITYFAICNLVILIKKEKVFI